MMPILISSIIYLKLICIKRNLFSNTIYVTQPEETLSLPQKDNPNLKLKAKLHSGNDVKSQYCSDCTNLNEALTMNHKRDTIPSSDIADSKVLDSGAIVQNNFG